MEQVHNSYVLENINSVRDLNDVCTWLKPLVKLWNTNQQSQDLSILWTKKV